MTTWSNEAKSAANTAKCELCDGGYLRLYSAAFAALLVEFPLPNPAFNADVNGTAISETIAAASALAVGTIAVFRIYKSDGTSIVLSGDVSITGGAGDIQLDDVAIGSIGQSVTVSPITFVQG